MATDSAVIFEGRRWPAVRVIRSPWRDPDSRIAFTVSGKGQQWIAERPAAFWRSFSALDLPSAVRDPAAQARVVWFLSRHGDPDGQLDRRVAAGEGIVSSTYSWGSLIEAFRQVAAAWGEPNELGVSSMSDNKDRLAAADKALRKLLPADPDGDREISKEIEVLYAAQGLTLRPQTLRAFMAISAASARERGISMRECMNCRDWFELRRSDAIFCSPSCQAADHKRRATIPTNKAGK